MILTGKYNHVALVMCGATLVREQGGDTYVEPEGLDISDYATHLTSLEAAEREAAHIPKRRAAYLEKIMALKGYSGDEVDGLGFWIDTLAGWAKQEIDAGRLQSTPEMDALLSSREQVKMAHPRGS